MRVALYQCRPLPLDVAGNLQRLREIAEQAEGIDL
ncbi:MAG: carbon-nitrogen hydrolase, partial [Pseudomonas sp.]|nr:carbon-nitrogen hydrolase [Pseudomonas sp.]